MNKRRMTPDRFEELKEVAESVKSDSKHGFITAKYPLMIADGVEEIERLNELVDMQKEFVVESAERACDMYDAIHAAADYIGDESAGSMEFWEAYYKVFPKEG